MAGPLTSCLSRRERQLRAQATRERVEARRASILAQVGGNPGCSLRGLARATGIATGTLVYHVGVLKRRGLLVEDTATTRHYFRLAADSRPPNVVRAHAEERLRTILALLPGPDAPPVTQKDILAASPYVRSSTQHILHRLAGLGVATYRREGLYQRWNQTRPTWAVAAHAMTAPIEAEVAA